MNTRKWTWSLLVVFLVASSVCIGWGSKSRTTQDYMKVAVAGGGLVLDASGRDTTDLMKIAAACTSGGGTLYLKGCGNIETIDLIKIAEAGNRHVVFEF